MSFWAAVRASGARAILQNVPDLPDDPAPAAPPDRDPAVAAALAQLDLGPSPAAPLQRAAVAALAWLGELDRSEGSEGPATRPR